jgi:protein ImuB
MSIICVRSNGSKWPGLEACAAELVEVAPRVAAAVEGLVWLDARGLRPASAEHAARVALERLERGSGAVWGAGIGAVPVAAYVAAGEALREGGKESGGGGVVVVRDAAGRWLADRPLVDLGMNERLTGLLEGVGVERCGELATLAREAVEVRFGAECVRYWRWSRGEDERRLFGAPARVAESASLDFVDYVVTDPERLLFTTNALFGSVCEALEQRGAHARGVRLTLSLANGGAWERTLRSARPTASRATWLRLARGVLERLTVPDAVTGIAVAVEREEVAGAVQGDLFDAGFGTATAVETALVRLLETGEAPVVRAQVGAHPLVERRSQFEPVAAEQALSAIAGDDASAVPAAGLTLQVLPTPRRIHVETGTRRDHEVPLRYRDRRWKRLVTAAGPDRVSGGQWEAGYAREYFRGVDEDGTLVWLYRDGRDGAWYLHGWWD